MDRLATLQLRHCTSRHATVHGTTHAATPQLVMQRRDHAAIELHPLLPGHGDSRNLTASGSSSVHSAIGFRDRPFATRPKPDAIRDTATAATRAAPRLLDPTSSPPAYAAAWRHWRMEIENWDTFFTEVYAFHRGGGWTAVVMARVFHLM